MRVSLSFASVLFTKGNKVASDAGGGAAFGGLRALSAADGVLPDIEAFAGSLEVLAAVLRVVGALLRLTCSRRFARSASTLAPAERAADVTVEALLRDVLVDVVLVNVPFLRGAAGAGIAGKVASWRRTALHG